MFLLYFGIALIFTVFLPTTRPHLTLASHFGLYFARGLLFALPPFIFVILINKILSRRES